MTLGNYSTKKFNIVPEGEHVTSQVELSGKYHF